MQTKSLFGSRQESHYLQGPSNKKMINSSVKTPALLFYNPSQAPMINSKVGMYGNQNKNMFNVTCSKNKKNLINHQSSDLLQFTCQNHFNLPARYVSRTQDQDQQIYYCDGCAQHLLDQGFQVCPIYPKNYYNTKKNLPLSRRQSNQNFDDKKGKATVPPYPYPQREQEIEIFLNNLRGSRQQVHENHSQVTQILINSQQFYGQQIEQINDYFQTIIQSLELEKNKCYNHILLERQNAEKQARETAQRLMQSQKQLASMVLDIQENLDSVYSISWQNYELVMNAFRNRMSEVNKILEQIRQKGINDVQYRKIQFAGVPQSINSLSQIIIQNSYGSSPDADRTIFTQGLSSFNKSGNQPQHSIFDKLKSDYQNESPYINETQNHMMFSFDGQRMKSIQKSRQQQRQNIDQNQSKFDQDEIHLRLKKNKNNLYNINNGAQRVQGIKQVEQLDVVVIQDQQMMKMPTKLRFGR